MSVEFDTPINRILAQQQPKNQFRIDTSLPDITFLRQLSVQGRLRYFNGTTTITPPTGETFFLYQLFAKATHVSNAGTVSVVNDGNTRLSMPLGTIVIASQNFNILDSLVGDGTKSMVITATNAAVVSLGWVENTARIRDVAI